ncbi:MAG: protease inhibitor I42 family protein [Chloroflexi bacterium]|nr:protease inhibitor I42 family protein [Chloroflexota bacterium]
MSGGRSVLLASIIVAVALVACGPRVRAPLKVVERDSGSMIELRVGEQIDLVLDANPSTGYTWEVAGEVGVVKQVGEPQFKADSQALGAGGKMTIRFEAVAPGKEWLRLVYRRSWEEGVAPAKTFEVYIVVK